MDCKDLMIGDLVKYNGVTKMVDAIYLYSVSVHDPSEEWSISEAKTFPVDDIEPIKLTSDILVKNGFVRSKRWHNCTMRTSDDFRICVQFKCGGVVDYITIMKHFNDLINRDVDVALSIHYVHQLQHLLRLCGIEKELTI